MTEKDYEEAHKMGFRLAISKVALFFNGTISEDEFLAYDEYLENELFLISCYRKKMWEVVSNNDSLEIAFDDLSLRCMNSLRNNGIDNLHDLLEFTRKYGERGLLNFKGLGKQSLYEIRFLIKRVSSINPLDS